MNFPVRFDWRLANSLLLSLLLAACTFKVDRTLGAGELRGTVVFASTGGTKVPAAGATVTLEASPIAVRTDARGAFVIGNLPPGTFNVTITAASMPGGPVDSGLRISGITLDSDGSGLADGRDLGQITVGAFGGITGQVSLGGMPVTGAVVTVPGLLQASVSEGAYSFSKLVPGTYALSVFYADTSGAYVTAPLPVQVLPQQVVQAPVIALDQVTPSTTGSIAGLVELTGAGSSVGIGIALSSTTAGVMAADLPMNVQTSDDQGDYTAADLPAGIYTVTADIGGYIPVSVPYVLVGGPTTEVPTLWLSPGSASPDAGTNPGGDAGPNPGPDAGTDAGSDGGTGAVDGQLSGTVLSAGAPLAGAIVRLGADSSSVSTDSQGSFLFSGLQAGTYSLTVLASGGQGEIGALLQDIVLAAGTGGLGASVDVGTIMLSRFGTVSGTVTLRGVGVSGALITLPDLAQAQTASDGTFSLQLPGGTYALSVLYTVPMGAADGGPVAGTTLGTTVSAMVNVGVLIALPQIALDSATPVSTGSIQGIARLAAVGSDQGIQVAATLVGATGTPATVVTSDATGDYSLPSLPGGLYSVTASQAGFQPATADYVVVGGSPSVVPPLTLFPIAGQTDGGMATDAGTDAGPPSNCAPGNATQIAANCVCQVTTDCETGNTDVWACTPFHVCVQTCASSSDCNVGQSCDEHGFCLPPACGNDTECSGGQQCINGSCQAAIQATAVVSCVVVPTQANVSPGGPAIFSVVASDASSAVLPYEGAVTWSTSVTGATTNGAGTTTSLTGGTAAANGTVSATIGSTTCSPSHVTQYAPATAGNLRVVVTALGSGAPVNGATVVVGAGTVTTALDGSVQLTNPNPTGVNTVSVFATGFAYVTVVGTSATDILVALTPAPTPATYSLTVASTDFESLSDPVGTVHQACGGASLAGSLIDNPLTNLLTGTGPFPDQVTTGAGTMNVTIPGGVVVGDGTGVLDKSTMGIRSPPGYHVLWTLGGNEEASEVIGALSGGELNANLDQVLIDEESGQWALGSGLHLVDAAANSTTNTGWSGQPLELRPSTAARLQLAAALPTLPTFTDDTGGSARYQSALVMGGVRAPVGGFVPLGMVAGVDVSNASGQLTPDGIVDAVTAGGSPGTLPLWMAPRHDGVETGTYQVVALAAAPGGNLDSDACLASPFFEADLGGTTGTSVLSGTVLNPGSINYNQGAATSVTFSSFLSVPNNVTLTQSTRTLTVGADVSGVTFHRLDIGSGVTTGATSWSIYFPTTAATLTIPTPPAGFADPVSTSAAGGASLHALYSVSLGFDPPGTSVPETYDGMIGFDGVDMGDLSLEMDRFSVRWVPLQ